MAHYWDAEIARESEIVCRIDAAMAKCVKEFRLREGDQSRWAWKHAALCLDYAMERHRNQIETYQELQCNDY